MRGALETPQTEGADDNREGRLGGGSNRRITAIVGAVILLLLTGGGAYFTWSRFFKPEPPAEPTYEAKFETLYDNGCENKDADLASGHCVEIFYATPRAYSLSAPYFADGLSNYMEFGRSIASVPYVFPTEIHGNKDAKCIVDIKTLADADKLQAQCLANDKNLKFSQRLRTLFANLERNRDKYDALFSSDYADSFAFTRATRQLATVDKLEKITIEERRPGEGVRKLAGAEAHAHDELRDRAYFGAIDKALNDEAARITGAMPDKKKSVLIFVHGFDTAFDDSVKTAGYLAADLNWFANPESADARDLALGVPIVFSWPTRKLIYSDSEGNASETFKIIIAQKANPQAAIAAAGIGAVRSYDSMRLNYFESQLRADIDANDFRYFLSELVKNTDVEQINLIAHSMGNRIVSRNLGVLAGRDLRNKAGAPVSVRLIQIAADYGRREFDGTLPEESAAGDFRSTVYFSDDDLALNLSRIFQPTKSGLLNNGALLTERQKAQLERVKALLSKSGKGEDEWTKEDGCRLGLLTKACGVYQSSRSYLDAIDASDFRKSWNQRESAIAHNYFEYSPLVLSDMSCALRGKNAEEPGRSLKKIKGRNWKLVTAGLSDFPDKVDPDCSSVGRLAIGARLPDIPDVKINVYFDVAAVTPCSTPFNSEELQSIAPDLNCPEGLDGEPLVRDAIRTAAANVAERPSVTLEIRIRGRADCSNVSGKFDNRDLARRRADAIIPIAIDEVKRAGLAERTTVWRLREDTCLIESERRDDNKRRASITIRFDD
ncbi:MAG: alpha/beta hydrolase [Parvularculaceae bacterium]